jgi:hypothetical protein
VQVGDTSLWSKEVQRLLWAAGEARARVPRRERKRQLTRLQESPAMPADGDFFTEWQPSTGHPS